MTRPPGGALGFGESISRCTFLRPSTPGSWRSAQSPLYSQDITHIRLGDTVYEKEKKRKGMAASCPGGAGCTSSRWSSMGSRRSPGHGVVESEEKC